MLYCSAGVGCVALSGGQEMSALSPLAGGERTFVGRAEIDAVDPNRPLAMANFGSAAASRQIEVCYPFKSLRPNTAQLDV
jgi:hypothetical protein